MADDQNFASPIQLVSYLTQFVELETHTDSKEETDRVLPTVTLKTPWNGKLPTADDYAYLTLEVGINAEVEDWQMYRGRVQLQGRFQWVSPEHEVDTEQFTRFYLASGYSMLYGLVRGLLLHLTASSPHPRMMLPGIAFTPIVENMLADKGEDDQSGTVEQS